mgnify:FL=1
MYNGYFIANGRKWEGFPIVPGVTCRNNIADFAKHMGWEVWEFNCPPLGIHQKNA